MSLPKSVTKFSKDGVTFISSVDRVQYTMKELIRAALRDVGRFVCREFRSRYYGMYSKVTARIGKYTQYWVKFKYEDYPSLQVGLKPNAFYGGFQEVGTSHQPEKSLLQDSVRENIDMIVKIESQYLSALEEDDSAVEALINEEDYEGGAD